MAFKREGTDAAILHDLQQRRVAELLVEKIPDDEALLLKNGKYACTVCSNRPVLDTIEMLAMHRKGKKHLFNLSKQLSREHMRKEEATKRAQEHELKNGPQPIQQGRCKSRCLGQAAARGGTKSPRIKLMKSAPYSSCCSRTQNTKSTSTTRGSDSSERGDGSHRANLNPAVMSYVKTLRRKQSFSSTVEDRKRPRAEDGSATDKIGYAQDAAQPPVQTMQQEPVLAEPLSKEEQEKKRAKAQHYLNLRMAGWIRDRDGKWVKDENAEFDTDDEEPPDIDE